MKTVFQFEGDIGFDNLRGIDVVTDGKDLFTDSITPRKIQRPAAYVAYLRSIANAIESGDRILSEERGGK